MLGSPLSRSGAHSVEVEEHNKHGTEGNQFKASMLRVVFHPLSLKFRISRLLVLISETTRHSPVPETLAMQEDAELHVGLRGWRGWACGP